ncbi:MAG: methyltransferase domain-containing protein [Cyclobacteriaceae bacterium]|nr:methyltransferase domain-containing protein [Cyclobacteriaceae bacterium]
MKLEIDKNKTLWEQWSGMHFDSGFYDVPSFLGGKNTLHDIEKDEIGEVKGKTLLHLQCHFGLDSMSLARMGAEVTGVDISETAIKKAWELAELLQLNVEFFASDVYDLKTLIHKKYDMVFCSYGVIQWLPDLKTWADIISWCLNPGGKFYLADFHPVLWMLDENTARLKYPYDSGGKALKFEDVSSYAAPEIPLKNQEYNWQHGLGQVINSLIGQGLRIEFLNEHDYSPYPVLRDMVEIEESRWIHKKLERNIPYVFSVMAKKT